MKKRVTAIVLSMVMIFSYTVSFAQNSSSTENQSNIEEAEEKTDHLYARSPHAILLDMKTGAVLYEKKANSKVYPADLTKIMTAGIPFELKDAIHEVTSAEVE